MPRPILCAVVVLLLALAAACTPSRRSSAGFRLPDGDPGRGMTAFVSLECNSCHQVSGMDLPAAEPRLPQPVVLGGRVPRQITDGYLTSAIINPSHALAPFPVQLIAVDGRSRMPDYTSGLTARQLADLVAFLQAHYEPYQPAREYPTYY
jgi:mono/diheme cytochrome c family protein